jgi:hypothetical protein
MSEIRVELSLGEPRTFGARLAYEMINTVLAGLTLDTALSVLATLLLEGMRKVDREGPSLDIDATIDSLAEALKAAWKLSETQGGEQ